MKEKIKEAIRAYGTPLYIFDLDQFRETIQGVQKVVGENIQLVYAMKANPFLVKIAVEELHGIEVCSPGEFKICEKHKIPMDKIVLSGVYKEKGDIEHVLDTFYGSGIYTVESKNQLQLLQELANERGLQINILLRLTSGNQFGMDEYTIREIIRERKSYKNLQIEGIQYYSGTQKKDTAVLEKEVGYLDEFLKNLEREYGFVANKLEYGPGLFVSYFQKEKYYGNELEVLAECLKNMHFQGRIVLELGRYLAASCGIYVTKIVDWKENCGQKYAIVDGGIHHLNYYGQTMAMKLPYFQQLAKDTLDRRVADGSDYLPVHVCGALCTVSDVLVKNMPLVERCIEDVLVFQNTGAYSVTEGISMFLSRTLPKVVCCSDRNGIVLTRNAIESSQFNG